MVNLYGFKEIEALERLAEAVEVWRRIKAGEVLAQARTIQEAEDNVESAHEQVLYYRRLMG